MYKKKKEKGIVGIYFINWYVWSCLLYTSDAADE